jgi:hypothetical protein
LIEPRIYRAAFIPALLAFVVAMFSLESRPPAVPQALAADVLFDGNVALSATKRMVQQYPDRRPGSNGDQLSAGNVASSFRAQHFDVTVDRFSAENKDLVNVIGRRIGESPRQLVVIAARDADRVPDAAGSAADTASLMEIARTLEGRVTQKTLVLASVDGSTLGSAGAERLAGDLASSGPVEAVLVLSDTGVPRADGTLLIPWSQTTVRTGLRLQRTIGESLLQELPRGGAGRGPGTSSQFARLAFPLGIGDQAPFLDEGFDALRLSGSGELPPKGQPAPSADRLGALGRATLRTVFAYDAGGRVDETPSSYLLIAQKMLPRWSVALLVLALLLPLLAASVDSFARVRRRHEPVLPWLRWIGAGLVPFVVALAIAEFLVLVGQAPDAPAAPLPPSAFPLDGSAAVTLGICTLFFVVSWLFLRPLVAGKASPADSPGAGAALALVLSVASLLVWIVNPYAALALLLAFHLWVLVTASPVAPGRPAAIALIALGLLVPLLIGVAIMDRLSLGILSGLWYGFLLVTGHDVGLYTALLGALLLTCLAAAVRIALARRPPPRTEPENKTRLYLQA